MDACCVLLTGRAGAGKTTVGRAIVEQLRARHAAVVLVDDDEVRHYLADHGDGAHAAIAWLCRTLVTNGVTPIVAVGVPANDDRERLRDEVPALAEVYLHAPPELCRARTGRPPGEVDRYDEPLAPDLRVPTHGRQPAASAAQIVSFLEAETG